MADARRALQPRQFGEAFLHVANLLYIQAKPLTELFLDAKRNHGRSSQKNIATRKLAAIVF